jgi:hypothetical protein
MSYSSWHHIADRMAVELAPMSNCGRHSLSQEDPRNCPDCSIRRVYLDYLAIGGRDTRLEALFPDARPVLLQDIAQRDSIKLPGQPGQEPERSATRGDRS